MAQSCKEYFDRMPAHYRPKVGAGMNATYQFLLGGEGGGTWFVQIRDGVLEVGEGEKPNPDVTIRASSADYVAIAEGRMSPMLAMATGRFKIGGNLGLAMKLQKLFGR
jgi:putative sterol carrier protein